MNSVLRRLIPALRNKDATLTLSSDEYHQLADAVDGLAFNSEFSRQILQNVPNLQLAPDWMIAELPYRIKGPAEYYVNSDGVMIITLDRQPIRVIRFKRSTA